MRNIPQLSFLQPSARTRLAFQQSVKKGTIALQGNPQALAGHVIDSVPLLFQARALGGETFRESLHHRPYQVVGVCGRPARLIHESSLQIAPLASEICHLRYRTQGHRPWDRSRSFESCRFLVTDEIGSVEPLLHNAVACRLSRSKTLFHAFSSAITPPLLVKKSNPVTLDFVRPSFHCLYCFAQCSGQKESP